MFYTPTCCKVIIYIFKHFSYIVTIRNRSFHRRILGISNWHTLYTGVKPRVTIRTSKSVPCKNRTKKTIEYRSLFTQRETSPSVMRSIRYYLLCILQYKIDFEKSIFFFFNYIYAHPSAIMVQTNFSRKSNLHVQSRSRGVFQRPAIVVPV